MADIQIGEIVRVVISFASPGASVAQNVFYFELQTSSADEATTLEDTGDWFVANFLNTWSNISDASCEAFLLEMDILNGDGTVDRNIGDYATGVFGQGADDILPAAAAGYMQANSERSNSLGRKFIPFLMEVNQTDGFWTSATVSALAAILVDYLTAFAVDTTAFLVPGILSRVTQTFQEFLGSGYVTNVPAYQRRRKPTVGS